MNRSDEEAALLCAIFDNPDDDTSRLVYADWLQEHGEDARAEFVRIQCALVTSTRRELKLKLREWRLWCANRDQWCADLPSIARGDYGVFSRELVAMAQGDFSWCYHFRRGFPEISPGLPVGCLRPGTPLWYLNRPGTDALFDLTPTGSDQAATISSLPQPNGEVEVTLVEPRQPRTYAVAMRRFLRSPGFLK